MSYQLEGTIKNIADTIQITETLKKRNFVVSFCANEFSNKYEEIEIETYQDNCSLLDKYKKNDNVKVYFNLRCNKWESSENHTVKYFPHLVAWKIEALEENEGKSTQNENNEDLDNFAF